MFPLNLLGGGENYLLCLTLELIINQISLAPLV